MEPERDEASEAPAWGNLRKLIAFQVKLALDAARDFALSPVSIVAFVIDSVRKPEPEKSLYNRLMALGRRSDRVINLFDEYTDADHYTVDETCARTESKTVRR